MVLLIIYNLEHVYKAESLNKYKNSQITSTKIQINLNDSNYNTQSSFVHLVIDIWILFVFCFLRFVIYHLVLYLGKCLSSWTNTNYIVCNNGINIALQSCYNYCKFQKSFYFSCFVILMIIITFVH